jgi:hypothetical protein
MDAAMEDLESKGVSGTSGNLCQEAKNGILEKRLQGMLPTPAYWDYNTPRAPETFLAAKARHAKKGVGLQLPLKQAARMGMLPTPTGQEAESDCELTETGRRKTKDGEDSHSLNLGRIVKFLPTPRCQDERTAKRDRGKFYLGEQVNQMAQDIGSPTFQLNPLFVAEMMGFPVDWTVLPFLNGGTKA